MKKFLRIVCCALLCIILLWGSIPVRGDSANEVKLLYTIVNGRVIITGCEGEAEFLEIPQVIDSYAVTETANEAFYGCRSLKRLVLPPTMRKIGDRSFYACNSLKEVILPANLEKLGNSAFCGCTALEHIFIPDTLTEIPESCFRACPALSEVNIPCGIKRIGNFAFSGCMGLERVTLGEDVSEIGERAFFMCGVLKTMSVPSSTIALGNESIGYIPSNQGAVPMSGFILRGRKGSAVQEYAEMCGIKFKPSTDIVRRSSAFHPSKRSQQVSEICVLSAFALFLTVILANCAKKVRH